MLNAEIRVGTRKKGRLLACVLNKGEKGARWKGLPGALGTRLQRAKDGLAVGRDLLLHPGKGTSFEFVASLAVKPDEETDPSEWYRRAGARLYRAMEQAKAKEAYLLRSVNGDFDLASFGEGFLLASYRYEEYLSESRAVTRKVVVAAVDRRADAAALERARHVAESVALARDLVNRPACDLYPETLAAECRAVAERHGMKIKVIQGKAIEKDFPALFAVGKGSERLPCLIQIDYLPEVKGLPWLALCGKGITYDSGGYDIKFLESLYLMKKDMGGAASCLGALDLVARLQIPIRVTVVIAAAENMISGGSFRPGDVFQSHAGKSIEVFSTDAEGRLVLADALSHAAGLGADGIVDFATLTGAAKRFLSNVFSPVMGTAPDLVADLVQAGCETHERLMPFELLREFLEPTEGKISDVKNWGKVGDGGGGTLVAGGFLKRFVRDVPWAHVDMSNTSWCNGDKDYQTRGGSAFGVRLLAQFLADRAAPEEV